MTSSLKIGWSRVDLTPADKVLICGQFHARLSEGVDDPITATALVLDDGRDHVVFVSCDLTTIPDNFRDAIRQRLAGRASGLDPQKVIVHATHTHTAPELREPVVGISHCSGALGVDLPAMPVAEYREFAADRLARAIVDAWNARQEGQISFALGTAVVGHNRRWVNTDGVSRMYGDTNTPRFSHIEGSEDHSLGVVATRDPGGQLTGLLLNVPCTAQETEQLFTLSADFWYETRQQLAATLGGDVHILPQVSAAGDQSPHLLLDKSANARMLELAGRTRRQEIAHRIVRGAADVLETLGNHVDDPQPLAHRVQTIPLPLNALTQAHADDALAQANELDAQYRQEIARLQADPSLKDQPRWYVPATRAHRRAQWYRGVAERFSRQKENPTQDVEVHVVRVGEMVFATNPFEYYLDYGLYIRARSRAAQTFLVELAGGGTYVPSPRSTAGGGYGSMPASNPVGPEGGRLLAERTIEMIDQLWS